MVGWDIWTFMSDLTLLGSKVTWSKVPKVYMAVKTRKTNAKGQFCFPFFVRGLCALLSFLFLGEKMSVATGQSQSLPQQQLLWRGGALLAPLHMTCTATELVSVILHMTVLKLRGDLGQGRAAQWCRAPHGFHNLRHLHNIAWHFHWATSYSMLYIILDY